MDIGKRSTQSGCLIIILSDVEARIDARIVIGEPIGDNKARPAIPVASTLTTDGCLSGGC